MIKQLGCPTFFLLYHVSCADLRWKELVDITARMKSLDIRPDDIENLNYSEKFSFLNSNPLACNCQQSAEIVFKEVLFRK